MNSCEDTGVLSIQLNTAFELRELAERKAKLQRHARRYLDEHCDATGARLEGGMTPAEYAAEAGLSGSYLTRAVQAERRGRAREWSKHTSWPRAAMEASDAG